VEFGLDQLAAGLRPGYRSVMEFGFEQLCDQVQAISTCPDSSNLVADRFEAEFHYAIHPGRRPAASWNLAYDALSSSEAAS